jgi:hypothetical protein
MQERPIIKGVAPCRGKPLQFLDRSKNLPGIELKDGRVFVIVLDERKERFISIRWKNTSF